MSRLKDNWPERGPFGSLKQFGNALARIWNTLAIYDGWGKVAGRVVRGDANGRGWKIMIDQLPRTRTPTESASLYMSACIREYYTATGEIVAIGFETNGIDRIRLPTWDWERIA